MNEWPDESSPRQFTDARLAESAGFAMAAGAVATGSSAPASGGMVLRKTVTIPNSRGLHARAAAKLVTLAERFSACVTVTRAGQSVPACSIMGLMMLGAGKGAEVQLEAEGWDAKEALDAVAGLIEAGFNED